jgi:lysophospholipase L1-like esterase
MSLLKSTPREFYHRNKSNPYLTWGDKFEEHTRTCTSAQPTNCLIGDSNIERLSRLPLPNFFQENFDEWLNLGIGGDKIEHVSWRIQHGGFPANPSNVILWAGTNNLTKGTKRAKEIANSILQTVRSIINNFPSVNMAVMGVLPRREQEKSMQATVINNILKFKLPPNITFIEPPRALFGDNTYNREYFSDNVHLNPEGYKLLIQPLEKFIGSSPTTSLKPAVTPPIPSYQTTTSHSQPRNPILDNEFGIGEPEFLGSGWDGEPSACPPSHPSHPPSPPSPTPPPSHSPTSTSSSHPSPPPPPLLQPPC